MNCTRKAMARPPAKFGPVKYGPNLDTGESISMIFVVPFRASILVATGDNKRIE